MESERDEQIRELAYRIWQEEGYPYGQEVHHWLKAETIWFEQNRPESKTKPSKSVRSKHTKAKKSTRTETTARP